MSNPEQSLVKRLSRVLQRAEETLLVSCLGIMIVLAVTQILMRNVFDSGIAWGDPVLRILVLWVGLVGAMVAARDNNHIRIDLLSRFLSPRWHNYNARLTALFTALVCGVLAWHSARFMWMDREMNTLLFASVPAWIAELVLPLGFGIMAARYLLQTLFGPAPATDNRS